MKKKLFILLSLLSLATFEVQAINTTKFEKKLNGIDVSISKLETRLVNQESFSSKQGKAIINSFSKIKNRQSKLHKALVSNFDIDFEITKINSQDLKSAIANNDHQIIIDQLKGNNSLLDGVIDNIKNNDSPDDEIKTPIPPDNGLGTPLPPNNNSGFQPIYPGPGGEFPAFPPGASGIKGQVRRLSGNCFPPRNPNKCFDEGYETFVVFRKKTFSNEVPVMYYIGNENPLYRLRTDEQGYFGVIFLGDPNLEYSIFIVDKEKDNKEYCNTFRDEPPGQFSACKITQADFNLNEDEKMILILDKATH